MYMNPKAKKSALKKNMNSMLSMVIVAAVALSAATYAWFTFVSNPEVRNMDLYVRAAENIYLSPYKDMDQETNFRNDFKWFSTIEMVNAQKFDNDGSFDYFNGIQNLQPSAFPAAMADVSSVFTGGSTGRDFFGRVNNNLGNFDRYYNLKEASGTDGEELFAVDPWAGYSSIANGGNGQIFVPQSMNQNKGGYAAFDLYVKSSNSGTVYLDGASGASSVIAITGLGETDLPDEAKQYIVNTVRIGFYCEKDHKGNEVAVIWEPGAKDHVPVHIHGGTGDNGWKPTYAINSTQGSLYDEDGVLIVPNTGLIQNTYDFGSPQVAGQTAKNALARGTELPLFYVNGEYDGPWDGDEYKSALKFTVYIWIEGADQDTINAVAKSYFNTLLRFGLDADEKVVGPTLCGECGKEPCECE